MYLHNLPELSGAVAYFPFVNGCCIFNSSKLFGVVLDNKINFSDHVNLMRSKANSKIVVLTRTTGAREDQIASFKICSPSRG